MSDCEEIDFFWKSWISPGKRKKKETKKNNKSSKCKSNTTTKTNESIQKKKKKKKKQTKPKEETEGRKEKKKARNKNKMSLDLNDSFVFTCKSSAAVAAEQAEPEALDPRSSTEKLQPDHPTPDPKKKTKRKKVMFELSPVCFRVKRPKFVSSPPQKPRPSVLSEEEEAVRDGETGQDQVQPHGDDSQCTADDINSQDLFITQKTFRRSPSDTSSGEASDKAINPTPQRDRLPTEGSHKANENPKKEKRSLQTMKLNTDLTKEKHVSCPSHTRPDVVSPNLGELIVLDTSPDASEVEKHPCTSSQQAVSNPLQTHGLSPIPPTSTANTGTQTQNFFTTEFSSFLLFRQKSASTIRSEALKPLDLSLPQRVRKDLSSCVSVQMSATEKKGEEEKLDLNPSRLQDDIKDDDGTRLPCSSLKKRPRDRQPWSAGANGKGETTPSPQSETEHKSADTTTSSEDNEQLWRSSKAELIQVKVVQTRLNESFFFKTKGEGQSPRPESPLMKMVQGRGMKSRKSYMKMN